MLTIILENQQHNKITFDHTAKVDDVLDALFKAPLPKIVSDVDVPAKHIEMFLQHEVITGVKSEAVIFGGTFELAQCILLLVHNKGNYIAFHVDNNATPLNLNKLLNQFTSHENIQVTLIGGLTAKKKNSLDNIRHILSELLAASKNTPLEINAQCLIENNADNEISRRTVIRDQILKRADNLCRHLYGESLDLARYTGIEISNFAKKSTNPEASRVMMSRIIETKGAQWVKQDTPSLAVSTSFNNLIKNKKDFENNIRFLFTLESFEQLKQFGKIYQDIYATRFRNVLINLHTGTVYHTSKLKDTPNLALRRLYLLTVDLRTYNRQYQLACQNGEYTPPVLSETALAQIKKMMPLIHSGKHTNELSVEIKRLTNLSFPSNSAEENMVCDSILAFDTEQQKQQNVAHINKKSRLEIDDSLPLIELSKIDNLSENHIGHGGSASVWAARYNKEAVAIKTYFVHMEDTIFNNEKSIHHSLSHPAILKIKGYIDEHSPYGNRQRFRFIVLELSTLGTLDQYLRENINDKRDPAICLGYLMQLYSVLSYLLKERVIHRDIKPLNLLRFDNGVLKLCDFGLSLRLDINKNEHITEPNLGSLDYGAPESYTTQPDGQCHIDLSFDTYSAAMVAWLLITKDQHKPLQDIFPKLTENYEASIWRNAYQEFHTLPDKKLPFPATTAPALVSYIQKSLSIHPKDRPSPNDIVECLKNAYH